MSATQGATPAAVRAEARTLLVSLERADLARYDVVGQYVRFDDRTRHSLKDLHQRIVGSLSAQSLHPKNYLIWGPPGSGKSFLLQQVALALGDKAEYSELNLARFDEGTFKTALEAATSVQRPVLCFIDEIDARADQAWPYETLLPYLEPPVPRRFPTCFCLAGSGGADLAELRQRIQSRPKGSDLLSRIPRGHEFSVNPLTVGDKVLVALTQLVSAAADEGRAIREIEKLALYYIAVNPTFSSARQLRSLASECAPRIPFGEDRIRYDFLFPAGDPENKEFWAQSRAIREKLANSYVSVEPRSFPEPTLAPPHNPLHRLAVLPFTNMSPDPQDEFFAEGLTEEMISQLSQVPPLRVIARTSVMRFKGATKGVLEIGQELRVGTILEGSVRKAGTKIRVTAQLIDARTEDHLWTGRFDRDLDDIFAIQTEIAKSVTDALHLKLFPGARLAKPPSQDLDAFTFYMRGRFFWNKRSHESILAALKCFEAARDRDPSFARAYSGIADCYAILADRLMMAWSEAGPKAIANAQKALELDENLAEAHASLGAARWMQKDWAAAEREFKTAVELNPGYATAHQWYFLVLLTQGRLEEAGRELAKAEEADPLSAVILQNVGYFAWIRGQDEEALRLWNRTLQLEGGLELAYVWQVCLHARNSRRKEALTALRAFESIFSDGRSRNIWLGMLYGVLGMRREAEHHIDSLQTSSEDPIVSAYGIALTYGALGDADRFYDWIMRGGVATGSNAYLIVTSPSFEHVRADKRFQGFLQLSNLLP